MLGMDILLGILFSYIYQNKYIQDIIGNFVKRIEFRMAEE